jgi:HAD superfamily hydrolase (TIGR01509 family)
VISSPVIFDCDGVLVDSEAIYLAVDRECLEDIGLIYEDVEYRNRFIGLPDVAFYKELERDYRDRGLGQFPAGYSEIMKAKASERLERELLPMVGVGPFLTDLTGKIAVASSSEIAALDFKLLKTNLKRFFGPHIYSGEQVARGKPDPDLFLFSAQKMAAEPAACLVIEDSVNGVRAARSAGMEVWGFAGGSHADDGLPRRLEEAGAARVFSSYEEMTSVARQRYSDF